MLSTPYWCLTLTPQARIAFMDVSVGAHTFIAEREGIEAFPTLILYNHGQRVAEYHGGRTHAYVDEFYVSSCVLSTLA
jgi:thioredoxin-like negative regulator of GroEL